MSAIEKDQCLFLKKVVICWLFYGRNTHTFGETPSDISSNTSEDVFSLKRAKLDVSGR